MQPESIANSQHESEDEIHPFVLKINKRQGNLHFQFMGKRPAAGRSISLSPLFPCVRLVRGGWTLTPATSVPGATPSAHRHRSLKSWRMWLGL